MITRAGEVSSPGSRWRAWAAGLAHRFQSFRRSESSDNHAAEADTPETPSDQFDEESTGLANVGDFNPLLGENGGHAESATEVFAEIGLSLRKRREILSLTYDEVERNTHVRSAFLKALEDGALDSLPSPVQTRGILANYAGFLDLDVDAVLLRFADGLQARYREQRLQVPRRKRASMTVNTSLPPLRTFIASDLLFGGGVAMMLLLFAIWGINRVITVRSSVPVGATSPSISDVLVGTALPTLPQQVTLIPAQATAATSVTESAATGEVPTLGANIAVQLKLAATARTYMRITVDGKVQFEGRTEPGQDYVYQASRQIEVLTGNAAALQVTYNARDMGLMGRFGEVVDLVYTPQGAATPTSTAAPTRTPTPKVTATPTETLTPKPSVTPTAKPGG